MGRSEFRGHLIHAEWVIGFYSDHPLTQLTFSAFSLFTSVCLF
jgi:hypothetical protein